ncbi:flavin reductase family protein [Nonomuraea angiospora]|uniref:flavin reductase family protein n=1 Tax=Nonomuraea angiospora TaxID=46172 RepID=UPI0029ABC8E2|nr:flavin reductase family protein [Nonomuraea angiospora]MDX3106698.1 flavin reductase family protein [Nonomuraea angiospora]
MRDKAQDQLVLDRTDDALPGLADKEALRDVLGRFTTGVAVVTTMTSRGPIGMTVNSFASVSLDPPLVLFSVSRTSQLCPHLTEADLFAINILSAAQAQVSQQFAKPGFNRFGELEWRRGVTGAPLLPGVLALLECRVSEVHEGGDHYITVGRIVAASTDAAVSAPLLFFRGTYHEIADR